MKTKSSSIQISRSPSKNRLALVALFGGAVAIAFAPIFVRLSPVGPSATAFWRMILALPPLWIWAAFRKKEERLRSPLPFSIPLFIGLAGVFFAGDLSLWHWSIKWTSIANATLLINFAPVFVTLGEWFFFQQKVKMAFILSLGLALFGMTLIAWKSLQINVITFGGDALSFAAALFYAGYLLSIKILRGHFSTPRLMAWTVPITGLTLLPITLLSGESLFVRAPQGWAVLIGLALISQVAGQSLIAFALAHLPASFSSIALLVQPVSAALLAWLLLNEPIGFLQAIGGILVLVGILAAKRGSLLEGEEKI